MSGMAVLAHSCHTEQLLVCPSLPGLLQFLDISSTMLAAVFASVECGIAFVLQPLF
jgi:hypothetical protein